MYFDESEADWFTYRIADGAKVNLTAKLGLNFWREDHDSPNLPPAYGSAGWTANDGSVLLYDKYDIWEIKPDGTSPRMITGGARPQEPDRLPLPLARSGGAGDSDRQAAAAVGERRQDREQRVLSRGVLRHPRRPRRSSWSTSRSARSIKAKNADRVVFTQARFDEFPDLWTSDTSFRDMKKVSNANPQQADYVWGKAELMQYINADGKTLRAIIVKPDNFDPSKKYPLMVYIYEELSEGLHSYRAPNPGTSINITRYVSNGYVVLMPDIVYETGYPGESAEKCVIPAVNTVVAQGFIDPKRIGIQGHSWGGYQITHLITRTNMFAAVQAGASVSNMISAYGGIRWGTGMSRAFQYEKTQSRIGQPPWDAPLQFIENSPIFWVEKVHTPYLSIHNDEDDAVPWYQGIEFFSAMRRLGKEAYMFVYNGEPHGLRQRDNQKHWTVHQDEFFDHFLLGKPKPEWMEKGVPYPRARPAQRGRPLQAEDHDGGADDGRPGDLVPCRLSVSASAVFTLDVQLAAICHGRLRGVRSRGVGGRDIAPGEVRLVPTGLVIEVPARMFLARLRAQQHAAQARAHGGERRRRRRRRLLRADRRGEDARDQLHSAAGADPGGRSHRAGHRPAGAAGRVGRGHGAARGIARRIRLDRDVIGSLNADFVTSSQHGIEVWKVKPILS